jgi:hypothetical protein
VRCNGGVLGCTKQRQPALSGQRHHGRFRTNASREPRLTDLDGAARESIAIARVLYCYWLPEEVRMTLATTATHYTPEDLLALPDYGRFELIDGQLVERKMGAKSSYAATNVLLTQFGNY